MDTEESLNPTTPAENPAQAQVSQWEARVEAAKRHHEDAFKQMREDMRFARGLQWSGQTKMKDPRYVANIVQRHLRQREAALYAKNPKAVAHRRKTLDFAVWDGDPQSLAIAQQQMQMAQQIMQAAQQQGLTDPTAGMSLMGQAQQMMQSAQPVIQDYQEGTQRRQQLNRMAETLEIVWQHQTGEQLPAFKTRMKHLVRRTLTTGVGYLKLGYHRFEESRPDDVDRVTDMTEQLSALQARMAEMSDEDTEWDETSAEAAELQDLMAKVTGEQESYIREGLDFDFPRSTSLIIDPDCYQLQGFIGARWVAQEFLLTPHQVQEIYQVDLGDKYANHTADGDRLTEDQKADLQEKGKGSECRAVVWEVWDKHTGQTLTICKGHPEYLVAPKTPEVYLECFWPYFPLVFNGLEDEECLFPPSDVRLMHDMQTEMNLMRQRLREHRDAARPGWVSSRGKLDDRDKQSLGSREAHQIVEISGLAEQDDIRRLLQPIPVNPIDPNQYEVGSLQDDVYKVVGTQEAVMGGASGATATETSIAESSRLSAVGSAVDELDDFLTAVAKSGSHLLLMEMSAERVREIAGRGAVWPELSGAEVAKDLWLEVRAGSSGRPNKAAEIQNLERLMPFIMQVPGVKPTRVLEEIITRLDDRLDPMDFYDPTLPSMMAQNRQDQVSTGDAATDPNQQGAEGGDKNAVQQGDSNMGPRPPAEERNMDPNRRPQ